MIRRTIMACRVGWIEAVNGMQPPLIVQNKPRFYHTEKGYLPLCLHVCVCSAYHRIGYKEYNSCRKMEVLCMPSKRLSREILEENMVIISTAQTDNWRYFQRP